MAQNTEISSNFLPTSQVWDISELKEMSVTSPEFKNLITKLYQDLNTNTTALNDKVIGLYDTREYACGKTYFSAPTVGGASTQATTPYLRTVYRKVIDFGALPDIAVKTAAHGITLTSSLFFTKIYGTSADPVTNTYIPLPYADPWAFANGVELWVVGANVSIKTGSLRSAFTKTYITLEYIKD